MADQPGVTTPEVVNPAPAPVAAQAPVAPAPTPAPAPELPADTRDKTKEQFEVLLVDFEKVKDNVSKLNDSYENVMTILKEFTKVFVEIEKIKETVIKIAETDQTMFISISNNFNEINNIIRLSAEKDQRLVLIITDTYNELNKIKEQFKKLADVQVQSYKILKHFAEIFFK